MDRRTLLFVVVMTVIFFGFNLYQSHQRAERLRQAQANQQQLEQEAAAVVQPIQAAPTVPDVKEEFYVIQTPYQQFVFSNYGGSLVELNLPFESEQDPESVVKEIGIDRQMVEDDPANAHFPDHAYYTPGTNPQGPFVKHEVTTEGGYYPLLRRAIIDPDGEIAHAVPPEFYALNIVSKYPETARQPYSVKEFNDQRIVFETVERHRKITKTFSLPDDLSKAPYVLNLTIDLDGDREALKGLWLSSGVPEVELLSGRPTPAIKYSMVRQGKVDVNKQSLPKKGQPVSVGSIHPDWIVNSNGFFGIILDPLSEISAGYRADYVPGTVVPSRLVVIDQEYQHYKAAELPGYRTLMPLSSIAGKTEFRIFAGPFANTILDTVDSTFTNPVTGAMPNYIEAKSYHGYFAFISRPFSALLLIVLRFFHFVTDSWGFSIILLTIVLRLLLYPLSSWSMKSMRRMQKISPQVAAIQAKYKKDPRKGQMEVMALYRREKVNPFTGCLPLIIQMPFLIGMFDLLKTTFDLRGASFIPGWIDNLAAPDVLFSWNYPVFFIGTEFHLLPILLGVVMYLTQRFSSALPKDKSLWTDQQRQQRMMSHVMVGVFTIMFYRFPSGLNLYWLSSMIVGAVQQWIVNKQIDRQTKDTKEGNGAPKTHRRKKRMKAHT